MTPDTATNGGGRTRLTPAECDTQRRRTEKAAAVAVDQTAPPPRRVESAAEPESDAVCLIMDVWPSEAASQRRWRRPPPVGGVTRSSAELRPRRSSRETIPQRAVVSAKRGHHSPRIAAVVRPRIMVLVHP